jgi:hypothetical protein
VTRHDGGAPVLTDDGNNGGWRGQQCAQQWQRQMVRRAKWGGSLAAMQDKGAARTWRRRLHGVHMERSWRAVDSVDVRWLVVTEPPRCRHARVGTS